MTVDANRARKVFLLLILPFYVNDFAFIALNGGYGVYLADYLIRITTLGAIVFWDPARRLAGEKPEGPAAPIVACLLIALLMPVISQLVSDTIDTPIDRIVGFGSLFRFGAIDDPVFYWADLSIGLLLVAASEELVFRRFARAWLERAGASFWTIVLVSALVFSLMHWGSGPGRLAHTFLAGVVYMVAYMKLNRLWPLVLAHWLENFISFGPFDLT